MFWQRPRFHFDFILRQYKGLNGADIPEKAVLYLFPELFDLLKKGCNNHFSP